MKILLTPSDGSFATAPVPSAAPSLPNTELPNLREDLNELQKELHTWQESWRKEVDQRLTSLREELRPVTDASTNNTLQAIQSLSERVGTLEKTEAPDPTKLAAEIRQICQKEIQTLDEKLSRELKSWDAAHKENQAALARLKAERSPELATLEKKMSDHAATLETRLRENEKAVEQLREALPKPAPVPVPAPAPEPIPESPATELSAGARQSLSGERDAVMSKISLSHGETEESEEKPSLLVRFWRYLNAPAIDTRKTKE